MQARLTNLLRAMHGDREEIIDEQSESFQKFQIGPDDVVIAVMGITGTGKSTFISLFTEEHVEVSDRLESCTSNVTVYQCPMEKGTLHLLDTPGFDDTHKSEAEVLREIAGYLSFAYKHKIRLSGIIYLHRITDIKLGGSALRNLHMFKKLCGEESLGSVVLVTSWWNQVDPAVGKNREKQLMTTKEFWGGMIDNGSKVIQHDGSQQSAKSVVKYLAEKSKPIVLDIQRQMVEEQKTLDQTGAGLEIGGELLRQRQRYEEEIKLAQQDIKDAIKQKDEESAAQIKKTEQEFYAKIKKVEEDQEALRVTHEEARRQQEQENRRKREELRQKLHDVEIATLKIEHDSKLKRVELELKHKDEMAQRADRDRQRDSDWYQAELKRASQPGCVVS